MLASLVKAFAQLGEPRFQRVALKAVTATIAVYGLLAMGVWQLVDVAAASAAPWVASLVHWLGGTAAVVLLTVLFPSVVAFVVGFFLEEIAAAVEARHYPDLPAPRVQPLGEALRGALRFALVAMALNLVMLPAYLIPGVNLLLFFALNGYLLGREYFDLVSLRRLDLTEARSLRRSRFLGLWIAGAVIALLLTIPVANMFAPIVATAFMVHVFESGRQRHGMDGRSP
ncbi:MAG: EI24 domain-containing protein [Alphaproteobacteria bacterium]